MTGTYDPALNLLYWGTGNPNPVLVGEGRAGDNLYTCSIVALHPDTGKLAWYFQPSPHDVHDWDAVETPVLFDAEFQGKPRKLLAQASRNGFFFLLDRTNGEHLVTAPFIDQTWSSGVDSGGYGNPPSVTDGGDQLLRLMELSHQCLYLFHTPQLVRSPAPGTDDPSKVSFTQVEHRSITVTGIAMFP